MIPRGVSEDTQAIVEERRYIILRGCDSHTREAIFSSSGYSIIYLSLGLHAILSRSRL